MERFTKVPRCSQPHSAGLVLLGIGGSENYGRDVPIPVALSHALQHFTSGSFREAQVDDHQIGALRSGLTIKSLDKLNCLIAVGDDDHFALDTVFLKRLTDQVHIRGIVLDNKNRGVRSWGARLL